MKTVYVGLSGGVDSSVTAALLQQQGYRVVGVYMQNWTRDVAGVACPWKEDLADAKSVAVRLGIPFKVFNFEKQYKQSVVDYMIREYESGQTPNPDIMCNQEIKFKLFLETALADGADLIATGHYARVKDGELLKPKDKLKDQTYFLYRVTKAALERTLMPIGDYEKTEIRELAKKFDLPTASKPDSQGICFVGEVGLVDFLKQFIKSKPGPVKLSGGTVIGEHQGAAFYTLGQRHGLAIGGGKPYWVTGKDVSTNTVFVTTVPQDVALFTDQFEINDAHWIDDEPVAGKGYQVLTRYRGNLINCTVEQIGRSYQIKMHRTERAVTPGQSAVIYNGDKVLGGGIIVSFVPTKPVKKAVAAI